MLYNCREEPNYKGLTMNSKILLISFLLLIIVTASSWGWGWGIRMERTNLTKDIPDEHFGFLKHWGFFIILIGLIGAFIICLFNFWN